MTHLSKEVLGIDIGGTSIKSAVVNVEDGTLLTPVTRIPTPQPANPGYILAVIQRLLKQLKWKGAVGCGFPAIVKNGIIRSSANICDEWLGYDALKALKSFITQPVFLLNDADAAALAEMHFGAGRMYNHSSAGMVLMITLGTGIGSGMFVNGARVANTEFGHLEIAGKIAETWAATVIKEQEGLDWETWGKRVNTYLQMLERLLSPAAFIIGGGVSESSQLFFPYLDTEAALLVAEMGNEAGIIGAAFASQWDSVNKG